MVRVHSFVRLVLPSGRFAVRVRPGLPTVPGTFDTREEASKAAADAWKVPLASLTATAGKRNVNLLRGKSPYHFTCSTMSSKGKKYWYAARSAGLMISSCSVRCRELRVELTFQMPASSGQEVRLPGSAWHFF